MLKLTYIEEGVLLEFVPVSLDKWIGDRVLMYLRAASTVYVEPSDASFLLPHELVSIEDLERLQTSDADALSIAPADDLYIEVTLEGVWLAATEEAHEGIFVCQLNPETEATLVSLWEAAALESVISE